MTQKVFLCDLGGVVNHATNLCGMDDETKCILAASDRGLIADFPLSESDKNAGGRQSLIKYGYESDVKLLKDKGLL